MFLTGDMFDRLLCCRRKVMPNDHHLDDVVEEVVLQHTNNNKTEYITSNQLFQRLKGGTTAVVALIRDKRLVVAWLGDSQALLVRARQPVKMVEPHKPDLSRERERVEEMGGCVINIQGTWRVLGQLAVSRAIGDVDYKPFVSSECDIKSLEIEGNEDFLILACDGLWDTLTPEAAVNVVYSYLSHNDGDTDGVGRCLVEAARSTGSEDNITAVVVFLRPVSTLMDEEAARLAQGFVPEPLPAAVMCKDMPPATINAIFALPPPSETQFDASVGTLTSEQYCPLSPEGEVFPDSEKAATPYHEPLPDYDDEPMEGLEVPGTGWPLHPQHLHDEDHQRFEAAHAHAHDPQPAPTAEEVDAALAELDSIPDGLCEAGEVEEEEEEEEEWSYYRMEPQNNAKADDVLLQATNKDLEPEVPDYNRLSSPVEEGQVGSPEHAEFPQSSLIQVMPLVDQHFKEDQSTIQGLESQYMENMSMDQIIEVHPSDISNYQEAMEVEMSKNSEMFTHFESNIGDHHVPDEDLGDGLPLNSGIPDFGSGCCTTASPTGTGSPNPPGSPRSVEGFVTSVELNTAQETFSNFSINQSYDNYGGNIMEPTAGPFSVYVNSSPEPASLDPIPFTPAEELVNITGGLNNGQSVEYLPSSPKSSGSLMLQEFESPVEITHAQSLVEVVSPPSPVEITGPQTHLISSEHGQESLSSVSLSEFKEPLVTEVVSKQIIEVMDTSLPNLSVASDLDEFLQLESNISNSPFTDFEHSSNLEIEQSNEVTFVEQALECDVNICPVVVFDNVDDKQDCIKPAPEPLLVVSEVIHKNAELQVSCPEAIKSMAVEDDKMLEPVVESILAGKVLKEPVVESILIQMIETAPEPVIENPPAPVVEIIEATPVSSESTPLADCFANAGSPAITNSIPSPVEEKIILPSKKPVGIPAIKGSPIKLADKKGLVSKVSERKPITKTAPSKPAPKPAPASSTVLKASATPIKSAVSKPTTTKPLVPKAAPTKPPTRPTSTTQSCTGLQSTAAPTRSAGTASTRPTTTSKAAPTTRTAPAKPATTVPKIPAPRLASAAPKSSLTKRPLSSLASTDKTDSANLVNGTSKTTTRPTATRTTTSTVRKSLSNTTTTAASKPITKSPVLAEKDSKNSTNRILSSSISTPSKSTASATSKSASFSRTASTKSNFSTSKTSTTTSTTTTKVNGTSSTTSARSAVGIKSASSKTQASSVGAKKVISSKTKVVGPKSATTVESTVASEQDTDLVNGENKISEEETSVEVKEKILVDSVAEHFEELQISSSETVTATSTEQNILMEMNHQEVLVNGDH